MYIYPCLLPSEILSLFLISLYYFYSLFLLSSERYPRFLSLSILFTLSSSQVPRGILVSYLSLSLLLSLPFKFCQISLGVQSAAFVADCTIYVCPINVTSFEFTWVHSKLFKTELWPKREEGFFFFKFLNPEDRTDMVSRKVRKKLALLAS